MPPVMSGKNGILDQRLELVERELGFKPHLMVHYDPRMALEESVVVWDQMRNGTSFEFQQLRDAVSNYDMRGLDFLLKGIDDAIQEHDELRCQELLADLSEDYSDRAECHYSYARVARAFGKLNEAEVHLQKAIEVDAIFKPAFSELLGILAAGKRFADAVQVCQRRLIQLGDAGISEARPEVQHRLGELAMAAELFDVAVAAYHELCKAAIQDGGSLVDEFNYAESRRRAKTRVPHEDWKRIIELREKSIEGGAGSLDWRLNRLQAMHIPYAMLGQIEEASSLLVQVADLVRAISPRERLFSVAKYQYQSVAEFTRWNDEMLKAIESRRLWDGSVLPTSRYTIP
jgi:tetratricopeptide (TPR) repeat protein